MVKVQEYQPGKFMINVTKDEAYQIIKSLAVQLHHNDSNRGRIEFIKRGEKDANYFSIAVDEPTTKFHVMTNIGGDNPVHDIAVNNFDTIEKAMEFIDEFSDQGIMPNYTLWIREVTK